MFILVFSCHSTVVPGRSSAPHAKAAVSRRPRATPLPAGPVKPSSSGLGAPVEAFCRGDCEAQPKPRGSPNQSPSVAPPTAAQRQALLALGMRQREAGTEDLSWGSARLRGLGPSPGTAAVFGTCGRTAAEGSIVAPLEDSGAKVATLTYPHQRHAQTGQKDPLLQWVISPLRKGFGPRDTRPLVLRPQPARWTRWRCGGPLLHRRRLGAFLVGIT